MGGDSDWYDYITPWDEEFYSTTLPIAGGAIATGLTGNPLWALSGTGLGLGMEQGRRQQEHLKNATELPPYLQNLQEQTAGRVTRDINRPFGWRWVPGAGFAGQEAGRYYSDALRDGGGFQDAMSGWASNLQSRYGSPYQGTNIYTPEMKGQYGQMQGLLRGEGGNLQKAMAQFQQPYGGMAAPNFEGTTKDVYGGLSQKYGQPYGFSDVYSPAMRERYGQMQGLFEQGSPLTKAASQFSQPYGGGGMPPQEGWVQTGDGRMFHPQFGYKESTRPTLYTPEMEAKSADIDRMLAERGRALERTMKPYMQKSTPSINYPSSLQTALNRMLAATPETYSQDVDTALALTRSAADEAREKQLKRLRSDYAARSESGGLIGREIEQEMDLTRKMEEDIARNEAMLRLQETGRAQQLAQAANLQALPIAAGMGEMEARLAQSGNAQNQNLAMAMAQMGMGLDTTRAGLREAELDRMMASEQFGRQMEMQDLARRQGFAQWQGEMNQRNLFQQMGMMDKDIDRMMEAGKYMNDRQYQDYLTRMGFDERMAGQILAAKQADTQMQMQDLTRRQGLGQWQGEMNQRNLFQQVGLMDKDIDRAMEASRYMNEFQYRDYLTRMGMDERMVDRMMSAKQSDEQMKMQGAAGMMGLEQYAAGQNQQNLANAMALLGYGQRQQQLGLDAWQMQNQLNNQMMGQFGNLGNALMMTYMMNQGQGGPQYFNIGGGEYVNPYGGVSGGPQPGDYDYLYFNT